MEHSKKQHEQHGQQRKEQHEPLTLFEPPVTTTVTANPRNSPKKAPKEAGSPDAGRSRRSHHDRSDHGPDGGRSPGRRNPEPSPPLAPELTPRARLLDAGPAALSSAELLGVVLCSPGGSGKDDHTALRLAEDLVAGAGSLQKLRAATYADLAGPDGTLPAKLTPVRACRVLAAAELGRRMMQESAPEPDTISSPADVNRLLAPGLRDLEQEHFVAVLLGTRNQVLASHTVAVGTLSSCPVHPREVFKPAIKAAAAGVILAHNHPAGHLKPSQDDIRVTRKLVGAGQTVDIEVLDHVIIARTGYASLKELGLLGDA